MKEVIERCEWLVNNCNDKAITPDVKDDFRYLLEEIERLKEQSNNYAKRIIKAIEIYENRNSIEYKKKKFMEDTAIGHFMYEVLKGDDKE